MNPSGLSRYILSLQENYRIKPELDYMSLNMLEQFAWEKFLSAYNIYLKLSSPSERYYRKMAYKNVNKRVHELSSLGLIEAVNPNNGANKHNAKYYRLTEYGIYRLFLNRLGSLVVNQFNLRKTQDISINMLTFFHNYQDSAVFKLFVYPYFEKQTLFAIWNYLFFDLYGYLGECCRRIEPELRHSDISVGKTMFSLDKGPKQGNYESLLQYLKDRFNVQDILDIKKNEDNTIDTIYAASTVIKFDQSKKEVTIFSAANNEGEIFKYGLYPLGSKILAMEKRTNEKFLEDISNNSKKDMEEIIYQFVYLLANKDSQRSSEFSYYSKILSEDKKFMDVLERIYNDKHNGFQRGYKILRKHNLS